MPAPKNYAFIDSQNINLGFRALGWKLSWVRFREVLTKKYGVQVAYMFIGYMEENEDLYQHLKEAGFALSFKEVQRRRGQAPKGNVDAELVLKAMVDYEQYRRAVIVSSDGDFACLVRHLREQGKLERVLSPSRGRCSYLLKNEARGRIAYLERNRSELELARRA